MSEIKFPIYIYYGSSRVYTVLGYIGNVTDYKDNKGYVDKETDVVYICSKDEKPKNKDVPILKVTYDSDGNLILNKVDLSKKSDMEKFTLSYLRENSSDFELEQIVNNTKDDEVLYNEQALTDMNAGTSLFTPIIKNTDDSLKKIIKQAIIEKNVDINRLKHMYPSEHKVNNMKSALQGDTKMSIKNFNIWCELLGLDYTIVVSDNGRDSYNPLLSDISYSSVTDSVTVLDDEDTD